ncbi:MAG: hypothetical protein ACOCMX_01340 [Acetivibrio ethanolgignens]
MGRIILCCGEKAENPWYIKETDTKLYSIEELCYYIYNNIYIISQGFFTLGLANWIKEELKLPALADKLKNLVLGRNSCKDMVVTVLCGSDYYQEEELKELIVVMDSLTHMSELQREKYKADLWLKKKRYTLAAMEYRKLLGGQLKELTPEETGDIYHNIGITCLYTGTLEEAAQHFLQAYGRNQNRESLKAYVQACSMAGIPVLELSEEEEKELLTELEESKMAYKETSDYRRLKEAIEKKLQGHAADYHEELNQILKEWKREYRKKVG